MSYYFSKAITLSFEEALEKVVAALKSEGFGVLTEIAAVGPLASMKAVENPSLIPVAHQVREKLKKVVMSF